MSKVLIAGAGIFGVTGAVELARRGHEVHLADPGPIPHPHAASTDISKVLRMDYGADSFYLDWMAQAFEIWDAWNAAWGETLYHETGVLMLSRSEMSPGGYEHDSYNLLLERGIPAERMNPDQLRARFPAWHAEKYPDGYYNPRGGWAESGRVVERLLDDFKGLGGAVHEGVQLDSWLMEAGRVQGFRSAAGEKYFGDHTVLAAGAWTPALHPDLWKVMWPVAQDVFHFKTHLVEKFQPPHFPVFTADVGRTGWYGFPAKADGTVKIANHGPGRRIDPAGERPVLGDSEAKFRRFFADTFPDH